MTVLLIPEDFVQVAVDDADVQVIQSFGLQILVGVLEIFVFGDDVHVAF